MPARAPRPCSVPGCDQLVTDRTAQCLNHRRRADRQRINHAAYDRDGFRALSIARRRKYPLCEMCGQRWSRETDHIDGDKTNNDWDNLRALCGLCHRRRTARDQPGGSVAERG